LGFAGTKDSGLNEIPSSRLSGGIVWVMATLNLPDWAIRFFHAKNRTLSPIIYIGDFVRFLSAIENPEIHLHQKAFHEIRSNG
jgi:hypothetical protein